jgi:hypothetical protein
MKKIIVVDDMLKLALNVTWHVWLSCYDYTEEMIELLDKNDIEYHIVKEEE